MTGNVGNAMTEVGKRNRRKKLAVGAGRRVRWSEEAIKKYFDDMPRAFDQVTDNKTLRATSDISETDKAWAAFITGQEEVARNVSLTLSSVIIPGKKTAEGVLVEATSIQWMEVVRFLNSNWEHAYSIPPDKWEEVIAGAYKKAGFDEVTLTPRSGDFGRDVIAVKHGIGCVKILGSMKAYKPGHLVKHDAVRALLGVLSGERDASKGIITTTSDFAPRISTDPFIKPFLPTRLELMNGARLREWLKSLTQGIKR
jgi:restriction system protein